MDIIQMELWELLLALHSYHMCVNNTVFYKLLCLGVTGSCICGRLHVQSLLLYMS